MIIEVGTTINASREDVWSVISDIETAADRISALDEIEILERPQEGLVGLKWRETRTLFGKTATEVMWITDATEEDFYKTRAESHGFIYVSTMRVSVQDGGTSLTMTHESQPQAFVAKLLSIPMGLVFKGMMKKAIRADLDNIKAAIEQ